MPVLKRNMKQSDRAAQTWQCEVGLGPEPLLNFKHCKQIFAAEQHPGLTGCRAVQQLFLRCDPISHPLSSLPPLLQPAHPCWAGFSGCAWGQWFLCRDTSLDRAQGFGNCCSHLMPASQPEWSPGGEVTGLLQVGDKPLPGYQCPCSQTAPMTREMLFFPGAGIGASLSCRAELHGQPHLPICLQGQGSGSVLAAPHGHSTFPSEFPSFCGWSQNLGAGRLPA